MRLTFCSAFVVALLLTMFTLPKADDLVVPFQIVSRSLVFINNNDKDTGVGFVIYSNSRESVILTDAHVVSTDVGLAKTVSIYVPPFVEPLAAKVRVIPTDVDQEKDLAVLRIPVGHLPAACIRIGNPRPGSSIGIAAFTVKGFEVNNQGHWTHPHTSIGELMPFTYPIVRNGMVGGWDKKETEFIASLEHGFSGGPIFESRSGLVFGLNQRSIQLEYGPSNTLFTVSGLDFENYLGKHNVHVHDIYVAPSEDNFSPDITRARRLTVLLNTTDPVSSSLLSDDFVYALVRSLRLNLHLTEVVPSIGGPLSHDRMPDLGTILSLNKDQQYLRLCDENRTNAVVTLQPTRDSSSHRVRFGISLQNCHGDVLAAGLSDYGNPPPQVISELHFDPSDYFGEIVDTINEIGYQHSGDGPTNSALQNFFAYGVLLADGEHDAHLDLVFDQAGDVVTANVAPYGTAAMAGLRNGMTVTTFNGVADTSLKAKTLPDLKRIVADAEDSDRPIILTVQGGSRIKFNNGDLCSYLQAESNGWRDEEFLRP